MSKYRVSVSDDCIGCGACTLSGKFELKNGKAIAVEDIVEENDDNVISVSDIEDVCPVSAISVEKVIDDEE